MNFNQFGVTLLEILLFAFSVDAETRRKPAKESETSI